MEEYLLNKNFHRSCYWLFTKTISILIAKVSSRFNLRTQIISMINQLPSYNYRMVIPKADFLKELTVWLPLSALSLTTLSPKGEFLKDLNKRSHWFECSLALWRDVGGSGWWWWVPKRFFNFGETLHTLSSWKINVPLFGILWRHDFKWKKCD